jgi:hypothetical protein
MSTSGPVSLAAPAPARVRKTRCLYPSRPRGVGPRDARAVLVATRARFNIRCAGRRADGTDARRCVACWYDHECACVYADAEREAPRRRPRLRRPSWYEVPLLWYDSHPLFLRRTSLHTCRCLPLRPAPRNQRRFCTYPRRLLYIPSAAPPAAPTASAAALHRIGAAHSASPAFDAASSVGGVPTKDILLHEVHLRRKPRVYLNVGR